MRRKTRRGGGLGENSATWPPDKSSFASKIGSPENTDNLIGFGKGGKRRRSRKTRRRRRGGDPIPNPIPNRIPNRNQFEARTYEVRKTDEYPSSDKMKIKDTKQYNFYVNKDLLKK
jgi:hypothetical protein